MDLYICISVFSVMYTWILCTVLSAPVGEKHSLIPSTRSTLTHGGHVRNKRCSCATFLDRECVYFCHLDIIWVNTPERVVSYGLGNAPRTKRATLDSMATRSGPRCQCLRENDKTCRSFCRLDQTIRSETSPATVIRSAQGEGCTEPQCKHKLAADTSGIKSVENKKQVSPSAALRAASKTRQLLEKWMVQLRHRVRTWQGESTAS
ncbi:endothelin-1 [Solea senegalensis]|uniref:Endothelin-1 n=1 Tax=Solea senegalensis TaxID=28829 RepID=A0AAV6R8D0_SOLSE|nr:endothelin-1 [Solea senegalensis]KAG7500727.1 endothelin-1 [Solea senegalensis]